MSSVITEPSPIVPDVVLTLTTAGIPSPCVSSRNAQFSCSSASGVLPSLTLASSLTSSSSNNVTNSGPCVVAPTTVTQSQTSLQNEQNVIHTRPDPSSIAPASSVPSSNRIITAADLWNPTIQHPEYSRVVIQSPQKSKSVPPKKLTNLKKSVVPSARIEPSLPFSDSDVMEGFIVPEMPVLKPGLLKPFRFVLPNGKCFIDKVLPRPTVPMVEHKEFHATYHINLHHKAVAPGQRGQYRWREGTPNYLGARIPLEHTTFNLSSWRKHLIGYQDIEVLQFLEFGFPLGLNILPTLSPALANHGSSYQYYPWMDKFFAGGLLKGGVTGPCGSAPFANPMVSPLMTAFKKPNERRAVYDASFGEFSLNNSTPSDNYLGEQCLYTYPKIEDFQHLILKCGRGCLMWKRDLSRYYLQLPLDPTEYCHTGTIWRGLFFFFVALMFGLRHSGLQGQKVTDALAWIHRNSGLEYIPPAPLSPRHSSGHMPVMERRNTAIVPVPEPDGTHPYNCVNYSDDLAGCETCHLKAAASFLALGALMHNLGLVESTAKACPPSTKMVFLGIHFDSDSLTMSIPPEKIQELRVDLNHWVKKTTAVRRDLQSVLGKMFWVSRVVRYSRPFMGRLLQQLRDMKGVPDHKKVQLSGESKKDITWWSTYLKTFNGVSLIFNDDDNLQTLEQLIDSPFHVYAGDATPWGGGGWFEEEYWSQELPHFLKPTDIPVHIKEFWVLIASCWVWGDEWSGSPVYLFCDNDSVCDTITYQKPRDPDLGSLLREFLYIVCLKKFSPIIRKIDTKSNILADHISRRHDHDSAVKLFSSVGKPGMRRVLVPDRHFKLSAPW